MLVIGSLFRMLINGAERFKFIGVILVTLGGSSGGGGGLGDLDLLSGDLGGLQVGVYMYSLLAKMGLASPNYPEVA